jgi:hypothetical protein
LTGLVPTEIFATFCGSSQKGGGMKKRLVALAVAALAATVLIVVFAGGGGAQAGGTTITVRERDGAFKFVDNSPTVPGVRMGDEFILRTHLFRSGNRVGTAHANCTATKGGRGFGRATFHCTGEYVLFGRGRLALDTVFRGRQTQNTFRILITGGNGEFFGRNGAVVATNAGNTTVHVIRLEP